MLDRRKRRQKIDGDDSDFGTLGKISCGNPKLPVCTPQKTTYMEQTYRI